MNADELKKQAAAAVKTAEFFSTPPTVKAIGRKLYEHHAQAGYRTPEGIVLVSRKLKSREAAELDAKIKLVKACRLIWRLDDSLDRNTSAPDNDPRIEYDLKAPADTKD